MSVKTGEAVEIYALLGELVAFLHQPMHFQDRASVEAWLAGGVYEKLSRAYYETVRQWLPAHVAEALDAEDEAREAAERARLGREAKG